MREVPLEEDALCREVEREHNPACRKADHPAACGYLQPDWTRKRNRKQRTVQLDEIARDPQHLGAERIGWQRVWWMCVSVLVREARQPVEIDERMNQRIGSRDRERHHCAEPKYRGLTDPLAQAVL